MMKRLSSHKIFLSLTLSFFLIFFGVNSVNALTVLVDQPLSFGRFVIVSFATSSVITINNDGSYSINANTYMIEDPMRGEYTVTDAPVSSAYTITVPSSVSIGGGPGGNFTLDDLRVTPAVLITDGAGEDQFIIAGRLTSAGGGTSYGDGTYSDSFNITFNF